MIPWRIAIVAGSGHEIAAEAISGRLGDGWRGVRDAAFEVLRTADLDAVTIAELDAVVMVVVEGGEINELLGPLALLEEANTPVLALCDGEPRRRGILEHCGASVEQRASSGPVLCAVLRGMLHRQREIDRLRHDAAVARRSSRGLHGHVAKMHEELHLAARAQREMLPAHLPVVHGVSAAALWRPAQYVSGDIYRITKLDEDHVGVFIADAVGHGVAAALMTMVIMQSLTTHESCGRILPPSEVLKLLNTQLIRHNASASKFATAAYGVVDCRSRLLRIAGAGHPPPLLLRGDAPPEPIETDGGLLGIFPDETFEAAERELEIDDRLLLYSDGFELAFPDEGGDARPTRHYEREFAQLAAITDPAAMVDRIARRLDVQSGSLHQLDDLTLICLHAGAIAPAQPMTLSGSLAA